MSSLLPPGSPPTWGMTGPEDSDADKGERESRASDAWASLNHSLTGKLPRALRRANEARLRIARLR